MEDRGRSLIEKHALTDAFRIKAISRRRADHLLWLLDRLEQRLRHDLYEIDSTPNSKPLLRKTTAQV